MQFLPKEEDHKDIITYEEIDYWVNKESSSS